MGAHIDSHAQSCFQGTSHRESECYAALERKAALYDKLGKPQFCLMCAGLMACDVVEAIA